MNCTAEGSPLALPGLPVQTPRLENMDDKILTVINIDSLDRPGLRQQLP
jgi:hypothetical protein